LTLRHYTDVNLTAGKRGLNAQMTVDSTKIFGCPMCGFRVNEGDSSCPRCGNQVSSETKFECPFCGELVEQGSTECPSCHVNYGEFKESSQVRGGDDTIDALLLEVIQLEAQSAKAKVKKFSCPGCSWMLEIGEERCPRCGRDLTADEEALQCPICGSAVSADSTSCPECGSSFDTEERAEDAEGASPVAAGAREGPEIVREQMPAPEAEPEPLEADAHPEAAVPEDRAPEPVAEQAEEAPSSPTPAEELSAAEEEEPAAPSEPEEERARTVTPVRVVPRPIRKHMKARAKEPEKVPDEPEREEAPAQTAERDEGPEKKPKQRKLKTRKLRPR
jgi:RNA polymerase subunit RPABC4/transcription elongation factor Spt4